MFNSLNCKQLEKPLGGHPQKGVLGRDPPLSRFGLSRSPKEGPPPPQVATRRSSGCFVPGGRSVDVRTGKGRQNRAVGGLQVRIGPRRVADQLAVVALLTVEQQGQMRG